VSDRAFKGVLGGHEQKMWLHRKFVAEKSVDVLPYTVAILPNGRLRISKEGPMKSVWQRLRTQITLDNRPGFLGSKSFVEPAERYADAAAASAFVLFPESSDYIAADAMAMGCAVVVAPSGALPEQLLADDRGFVAPAPTPEALARALHEALEDDGRSKVAECIIRDLAKENLNLECVGPKYEVLHQAATS